MTQRYVFVVKFIPERAESKLLAGRCIKVLHDHMYGHKNFSIGIGFPEWSEQSLGAYISFVSTSHEHLLSLKKEHYFHLMESEGFFGVSKVVEVPSSYEEVRFLRNQNFAKCFVGEKRRRMLRAKRRAEARGEVYIPQASTVERRYNNYHVAQMNSSCSQQQFFLFIQKETNVAKIPSSYSSYGLSTNSRYRGTVPELAETINTLF